MAAVEEMPQRRAAPRVVAYPPPGAIDVYRDVVLKVSFSAPVLGVDSRSFTLRDSRGAPLPAHVDQIGDATWGLFPDRIYLEPAETYTARLQGGICDPLGNCMPQETVWSFTIAATGSAGRGDTTVPMGFAVPNVVARK